MRSAVAVLALLASASPAWGQAPAPLPQFQLERFRLDAAGTGSLVVGSGLLLEPGTLRVAAALHYQRDPLVLEVNGQRTLDVVSSRLGIEAVAAFALHPRFEIGAELPVVVGQSGQSPEPYGYAAPSSAGVGEPIVTGRFGILSSSAGAPLDLAASLGLGLPIGSRSALANDAGLTAIPGLQASLGLGETLLSAQVGALLRRTVSLAEDRVGAQLDVAAALSHRLRSARIELAARAAAPFTGIQAPLEVLAGVRLPLPGGLELFAIGGPGIRHAPGTPAFRVLAGLSFERARPPDRCAPGLVHHPAQCPDLDDDQDGIRNADDRCPLEAGPPGNQGCPVRDRDGDGVPDDADRCPDEPGPVVNEGCPVLDRDGDGVPDDIDRCPDEPGPADNLGCPVQGVEGDALGLDLRALDPDVPCPLPERYRIFFEFGTSVLRTDSNPLIDEVARIIAAHPEIPIIDVDGHTDSRGSPEANRRLSLARAEAVCAAIARRGVDRARLVARGFGPDQPSYSNATEVGRQRNRRVEFNVPGVTLPERCKGTAERP
jgi:outer membrane protein OmpA-like peptidoglycan-associated protein